MRSGRTMFISTALLVLGMGWTTKEAQADFATAEELAKRVTIYRDSYGVPHVDADDPIAAAFGFGYAQCEDYFWQVEDSLIFGIGRYAEVNGKNGIDEDLVTHAFEIPERSKADVEKQPKQTQEVAHAFATAINFYLKNHPEVKPRLITHVEPWHLLAFNRRIWIDLGFRASHVSGDYMPHRKNEAYEQIGSNAWAVGPTKTKDKTTMLFINPHQPFYGWGQWYEGHIRTKDGIDFYGASFFASPMLSIGHNATCGWSFTVNEPDVVDKWNVKFDDPDRPNFYRHGDGYREATVWTSDVKVKGEGGARRYTFRKTHHGPLLRLVGPDTYEAVQVGRLYDNDFVSQIMDMVRSKNVHDFRRAMGQNSLPIFNGISADSEGNIFYLYNGAVPKRNEGFDWRHAVDGNNPATDWKGYHPVDDLPQILNPPSGYLQSCNASPFTTTDDGNPFKDDYPSYMVIDKDSDKRRSKMSRMLLREAKDLTLDQFESLGFDTHMYWAINELPRLKLEFARIEKSKPELAAKAKPYFDHFNGWNCEVTADCDRSPLCAQWYEELYGFGYPVEDLKAPYKENPDLKFEALINAAKKLTENYGTWKVKWGDVYRLQRHQNVADLLQVPLSDKKPSIPLVGAPGPLGVIFTMYYSPSVYVPFVREMKKHYAVVGTSYMGVVEFKKDGVDSRSVIQYGSNSDPKSPNFIDQGALMAQKKMKRSLFNWNEIQTSAKRKYHPGAEPKT
ncbi:penicillin acylase family protein [bacterium]|nr:penicillin acylase family protein [bacterium]